jgi:hypothetical protein
VKLEDRTTPSTYYVTDDGDSFTDPNPGDNTGTLRQAIVDANNNSGADDIVFDTKYWSTSHTINLLNKRNRSSIHNS